MLSSLTPEELTARPSDVLLHELLIHKVELEMQNEELRCAYISMEEARDRYVDIYEFAPIGYITINRAGLISKINLTGAALLGVDRIRLINRRFSNYVSPHDQDRWHRLFMNAMERDEIDKHAFNLEMTRADAPAFHAHLDCLRHESIGESPTLRISLFDISKFKHADAQTRLAAIAFESREGMMVTDANLNILRVNLAFTTVTGYEEAEVIGKKPGLLSSKLQNADFYAAMRESINLTGGWVGEILNERKNGNVNPARITITAVKDANGVITNYVATLSDINADK